MSGMKTWERDIHDALRKENWSLSGYNRIVKVLPRGGSAATQLGGYITVGSSLLLKTPQQIEDALGLKKGYLAYGARIYRFTRLPVASEYEYELTALYPGGLAFNPAHSNPYYPEGSRVVHQWKIKDGVQIPVDPKNFLDLSPGQPFPGDWLK